MVAGAGESAAGDGARTPATPRLACTVLLVRDRGGLEVLMVERHENQNFASALVFPGGLVDEDDGFDAWGPMTIAGAGPKCPLKAWCWSAMWPGLTGRPLSKPLARRCT